MRLLKGLKKIEIKTNLSPRGAEADVARAGEIVDRRDLFLVAAIARRQQEGGAGGIVFHAQNFGIENAASGFVISSGQNQ